jgi:hypothetical protein
VAFAIFFAAFAIRSLRFVVKGFGRGRTTLSRPKNYIPIIIVF